jgi:hypothetical protein
MSARVKIGHSDQIRILQIFPAAADRFWRQMGLNFFVSNGIDQVVGEFFQSQSSSELILLDLLMS